MNKLKNFKDKYVEDVNFIKDFLNNESNKNRDLTFVALKPGSVNLTAINVVLQSLNYNGYKVVFHAPAFYTNKNVQIHYKEIYDKYKSGEGCKFYPELEEYLTRDIVYGLVVEGPNAVKGVKALCGDTKEPAVNTMRYELFKCLGLPYDKNENGIHASGEVNEARREIMNFFDATLNNINYLEKLNNNQNVQYVCDYINAFNELTEDNQQIN